MTKKQIKNLNDRLFSVSGIIYLLLITYVLDKKDFSISFGDMIMYFILLPILFFIITLAIGLFIYLIDDAL
jgi:membrane protein insertase Oxa1/YidC/SpoIIIJ